MSEMNVLQPTFRQGELSPRFIGQPGNEAVRQGLQRATNAVVLPQGPVMSRMGTEFVGDTGLGAGDNVRLWPFIDPDNEEVIGMFTHEQVQLVDPVNGIVSGATEPFILSNFNSDFIYKAIGWDHTPSYYIDPDEYFYWRTYWPLAGDEEDIHLGWRFNTSGNDVAFPIGTEATFRPYVAQSTSVTDAAAVRVVVKQSYYTNSSEPDFIGRFRIILGTTPGGNDLGELNYAFSPAPDYESGAQPTRSIEAAIPPNGPGGYTGEIYYRGEFILEEPTGDYSFSDDTNWETRMEDFQLWVQPTSSPAPISLPTPYSNTEVNELHFVQSPFDNRELVILHPQYEPRMLYVDPSDQLWKFEIYDISPYPAEWVAGNWPSIGAGFESRLWLSGAPQTPEIIWASAVFDWKTMSPTGTSPDNPLALSTQVRAVNTWILGFKRLLFGDVRTEYEITSDAGPLVPGGISLRPQSGFGSLRLPQKIMLDKYVVFNGSGNTDFRLLHYSDSDGGFIAPNMVLKAEHIGKRIFQRSFYTREPHQIMWSIMGDGTIAMLNFDGESEFAAWSTASTEGEFLDGCSIINQNGESNVMLAVRRTVDNASVVYLERVNDLRFTSRWKNMDCVVRQFVDNESGQIAGFDALEGNEVAIIADDQYVGMQTVTGGEITLDIEASVIEVGLPYTFSIKTFPQIIMGINTGLAAKKRFSSLGVRGLYSRPPMINGVRPPDRSPSSVMDLSEPARTVYDSEVTSLSIDGFGEITISEDTPFPVTISAIYGKLTSNQL